MIGVEYVPSVDAMRHHCPIDACPWSYDESLGGPNLLHIEPGQTVAQAVNDRIAGRNHAVGAAMTAHAEKHPMSDWASEVRRLHDVIRRMEHDAYQPISGVRPHLYD